MPRLRALPPSLRVQGESRGVDAVLGKLNGGQFWAKNEYLRKGSFMTRNKKKPNEKPIERRAVKSSNVVSVGFCPERKCVEVEYKGGVYRYHDCNQALFDNLLKAQSIGKFVHKHLNPKKFTKI